MRSTVYGGRAVTPDTLPDDIDVVADIRPEHVPRFVEMLGPEYYVSADAMQDAVRSEGTFDVIHVQGSRAGQTLQRATIETLGQLDGLHHCFATVASSGMRSTTTLITKRRTRRRSSG